MQRDIFHRFGVAKEREPFMPDALIYRCNFGVLMSEELPFVRSKEPLLRGVPPYGAAVSQWENDPFMFPQWIKGRECGRIIEFASLFSSMSNVMSWLIIRTRETKRASLRCSAAMVPRSLDSAFWMFHAKISFSSKKLLKKHMSENNIENALSKFDLNVNLQKMTQRASLRCSAVRCQGHKYLQVWMSMWEMVIEITMCCVQMKAIKYLKNDNIESVIMTMTVIMTLRFL